MGRILIIMRVSSQEARNGQQSGKSYLLAWRKTVPAPYCLFCRPFNYRISAHGIPKFTPWVTYLSEEGQCFLKQRARLCIVAPHHGRIPPSGESSRTASAISLLPVQRQPLRIQCLSLTEVVLQGC